MNEETPDQDVEFEGPDIPRFEFETRRGVKGWAEFKDRDDVSQADVMRIRKMMGSSENMFEASNLFQAEVMAVFITAWEVPGKPDLRLPRHDAKAWAQVPATFGAALEQYLMPFLEFLKPKQVAEGEPGSPHRPGSE